MSVEIYRFQDNFTPKYIYINPVFKQRKNDVRRKFHVCLLYNNMLILSKSNIFEIILGWIKMTSICKSGLYCR